VNGAVIVNPAAGRGGACRRWPEVARLLGPMAVRFTEGPGHASALARELAAEGFDPIVAAGGDGTLHEVVNALVRTHPEVRIGLLPLASGGDFARTLGISSMERAVEAFHRGHVREVDVLRLSFRNGERFAINAVGIGLAAIVAEGARHAPRLLPGKLRYLASAIMPLARGETFDIRVSIDGAEPRAYHMTTSALANGRYQGGGICIAPEAAIDDGWIDVTVVERVSLAEVCRHLPILYSGKLLTYPKVRNFRAARVRVESDRPVAVETDGELAGTLPVEAEILPRALRLIG